MKTVTLIDGRQVANDSPEWMHECEARSILALPNISQRRTMLAKIGQRRGDDARRKLERTMLAIFRLRKAGMMHMPQVEMDYQAQLLA
jgi:TRAP-type uncharacterized transport system substrate-binding protein